jgi:hypothetical protein
MSKLYKYLSTGLCIALRASSTMHIIIYMHTPRVSIRTRSSSMHRPCFIKIVVEWYHP